MLKNYGKSCCVVTFQIENRHLAVTFHLMLKKLWRKPLHCHPFKQKPARSPVKHNPKKSGEKFSPDLV
ncbi:MAG: hypothetical protein WBH77_02460 [Saccharofermentanales bacterium]